MNEVSEESVAAVVLKALRNLFRRDSYLLDVDASERAITHRLAIYLQAAFKDWDVDCEYNRNGLEPKTTRLPVEGTSTADEHAVTIFPDIIVHHRDSEDNLLAIEIKKSSSNIPLDFDRRKLRSYRRKPLCYQHTLLIVIRTDGRMDEPCRLEWIRTNAIYTRQRTATRVTAAASTTLPPQRSRRAVLRGR